jgi:hypothetical protein
MRPAIGSVITLWLFLGACPAPAQADGGALRASEVRGPYRISVFTAPTPLRAGAVDFSVLVQDASTGAPAPGVDVILRLGRSGGLNLEYPATTAGATNKLFHAAQFDLPDSGRWNVQVHVKGSRESAVLDCQVDAALPLPRWTEIWPWIAWIALPILLFIANIMTSKRARAATRTRA